jgi:hypothetical protein
VTPSGRATSNTAGLMLLLLPLFGLLSSACGKEERAAEPALEQGGQVEIQVTPARLSPAWLLETPEGLRLPGRSDSTLVDAAAGSYTLTWNPLAGWTSPQPNPVSQSLSPGGVLTFDGTYIIAPAPTSPTGTVVVDPKPSIAQAPWTLLGPNNFSTTGAGFAALLEREIGSYTVTWNGMTGWTSPAPSQQTAALQEGGMLTFSGTYVPPPHTGTVVIQPERDGLDTPWSLVGPNGYGISGTRSATLSRRDVGSYTVTWHDVTGWGSPVPSQETRTLKSDSTITFRGVYANPTAPRIASLSGVPTNGGLVQLLGDSLGTHTLDIEWTGDWIEAQAPGTNPDTRANWAHALPGYTNVDKISTTKAWSGTKSIVSNLVGPDYYESTLQYIYPNGGTFTKIYATWWVYFEPMTLYPTHNTQWKFFRISPNYRGLASNNPNQEIWPVNTQDAEMYWPMYISPAATVARSYVEIHCKAGCGDNNVCSQSSSAVGYTPTGTYSGGSWMDVDRGTGDLPTYAPTVGGWCRVETYAYCGTMDQSDGSLRVTIIKPNTGIRTGFDWMNLKFQTSDLCASPAGPWKTILYQNYFANSADNDAPHREKANIYMDDIYLQFGTQARVEIGDQPRYQDCTRLEIQQPTGWSDKSITIRLNHGAFSRGQTVYVFVIRGDGVVSSGTRLVLQ